MVRVEKHALRHELALSLACLSRQARLVFCRSAIVSLRVSEPNAHAADIDLHWRDLPTCFLIKQTCFVTVCQEVNRKLCSVKRPEDRAIEPGVENRSKTPSYFPLEMDSYRRIRPIKPPRLDHSFSSRHSIRQPPPLLSSKIIYTQVHLFVSPCDRKNCSHCKKKTHTPR